MGYPDGFLGITDVGKAKAAEVHLRDSARAIVLAYTRVSDAFTTLAWEGPNRDRFGQDLKDLGVLLLLSGNRALLDIADRLARAIAAQERASG
jgi:hypothetical protein